MLQPPDNRLGQWHEEQQQQQQLPPASPAPLAVPLSTIQYDSYDAGTLPFVLHPHLYGGSDSAAASPRASTVVSVATVASSDVSLEDEGFGGRISSGSAFAGLQGVLDVFVDGPSDEDIGEEDDLPPRGVSPTLEGDLSSNTFHRYRDEDEGDLDKSFFGTGLQHLRHDMHRPTSLSAMTDASAGAVSSPTDAGALAALTLGLPTPTSGRNGRPMTMMADDLDFSGRVPPIPPIPGSASSPRSAAAAAAAASAAAASVGLPRSARSRSRHRPSPGLSPGLSPASLHLPHRSSGYAHSRLGSPASVSDGDDEATTMHRGRRSRDHHEHDVDADDSEDDDVDVNVDLVYGGTGGGDTGVAADSVAAMLKAAFMAGRIGNRAWRAAQLTALGHVIAVHRDALMEALCADGHCAREALFEIKTTETQIARAQRESPAWTEKLPVETGFVMSPTVATTAAPRGVILILASCEYPLMHALVPLAAALAAGNAVILCPNPRSPKVHEFLHRVIPTMLDSAGVVMQDSIFRVPARIDYVWSADMWNPEPCFKAGSMGVESKYDVMGKCPAIVDDPTIVELAAKRIVESAFTSAGQFQYKPSYVLTTPKLKPKLVECMTAAITTFFVENPYFADEYSRLPDPLVLDQVKSLLIDHTDLMAHTALEDEESVAGGGMTAANSNPNGGGNGGRRRRRGSALTGQAASEFGGHGHGRNRSIDSDDVGSINAGGLESDAYYGRGGDDTAAAAAAASTSGGGAGADHLDDSDDDVEDDDQELVVQPLAHPPSGHATAASADAARPGPRVKRPVRPPRGGVVAGGRWHDASLLVHPTVVICDAASPLLSEPSVGPILPVVAMSKREMLAFVQVRQPFAVLYHFTKRRDKFPPQIARATVVNDTLSPFRVLDSISATLNGAAPSARALFLLFSRPQPQIFAPRNWIAVRAEEGSRFPPTTRGKLRSIAWHLGWETLLPPRLPLWTRIGMWWSEHAGTVLGTVGAASTVAVGVLVIRDRYGP
ncbi:hypothetical protein BC828DRAFT_59386 [Blastocladiella britannica]|nr:hypothetical protein BC828DRAFT_59386 [Blastocladiella britannica]